jgi:hypothetical protein
MERGQGDHHAEQDAMPHGETVPPHEAHPIGQGVGAATTQLDVVEPNGVGGREVHGFEHQLIVATPRPPSIGPCSTAPSREPIGGATLDALAQSAGRSELQISLERRAE